MTPVLWTLESVSLAGPRRPRLDDVSGTIRAGRTAIIGESGAGKTSLLNLLVGFETPTRGRVVRHPAEGRRLPLFWSPADGGLWPHLSPREHLRSVSPSSSDDVVDELLASFDLQSTAANRTDDLSAGERSRLSIARALAADAEVLVLDEPLSHVDPARLERDWGVIRNWCDSRRTSLVFSSHQPEIVVAEAEQGLCLVDGRLIWSGDVRTLYDNPPTEQAGWALGPLNWFDPSAAARWLNASRDTAFGLRPERILVQSVEADGPAPPATVESVRDCGRHQSMTLRSAAGEIRNVYARTSAQPLTPGVRVLLKTVMTCLVALGLAGCGSDSSDIPEISVANIEAWNIPNEGAKLPSPRGLHVDPSGDLLVLDDGGRVMVYDAAHQLKHKWWMPEYTVGRPEGIWTLLDGRMAIADTHYHRILFMNKDGTVHSTLGEEGHGPCQFVFPETVIQDPAGFLYVCEYGGNDRIQKFTPDGLFVAQFGSVGTEPGQFQRPTGMVWFDHKLYVCDAVNNRVQEFHEDGRFERVVADAQTSGLYYPYDMAGSPEGDLFVAEFGSGRVTQLSRDGKVLGRFGTTGRDLGQFWTPWGIAASKDGRVFVADTGNRRLVELRL